MRESFGSEWEEEGLSLHECEEREGGERGGSEVRESVKGECDEGESLSRASRTFSSFLSREGPRREYDLFLSLSSDRFFSFSSPSPFFSSIL